MTQTNMPLSALGLTPQTRQDVDISGLEVDSRAVGPGALFAALPGSTIHGARFAKDALAQGAAAILTDAEGAALIGPGEGSLIIVDDPRAALAVAAARWFGAQPELMVAVTGTNGKTSVSSFVRQLWVALGHRAVNLGTTGVEGAWTAPLSHTTPDPITLHRVLSQAAGAGVTHAAMEASSHGLDQKRLEAVKLTAAAFTNLSQDHLDYHDSFDAYFSAKAGLFTRVLDQDGIAVINIDGAYGLRMADLAHRRGQTVIRFTSQVGPSGTPKLEGEYEAELVLKARRFGDDGQDIHFSYLGEDFRTHLPLIGAFQAENALLAAALVISCGEEPKVVFAALSQLQPVRGRMELAARRANGAAIFVDYAHTPDAIETALRALRPHVMGRLGVIIGAGGDRDRTKRVLMGEKADAYSDFVYVTDDNPRTEPPDEIRRAVMSGCSNAVEVPDRAEAILRAVDQLAPGDGLLIAGKGHETVQIIGDQALPFNDVEQASLAVAALEGGA